MKKILTKEEKVTIQGYVEHFDDNVKMAAAAHVFGLGIIKLKKAVPKTATPQQRKQIKEIIAQLTESEPKVEPKK